jgi:hypothetical protein
MRVPVEPAGGKMVEHWLYGAGQIARERNS